MLPPQAIEEFKQIYKEEFGVELSQAEATEKAINLFNLMKLLLEKKKKELKEYN